MSGSSNVHHRIADGLRAGGIGEVDVKVILDRFEELRATGGRTESH